MTELKPLVSIIIPVYNRSAIITETIQSVQNQIYQHWECIIIDDFSTDNSFDSINQQVQDDNRFTVLTNKRKKGAPGARNTGVAHSRGDYLIFLDSDDLLSPGCIMDRVNQFQQNPAFDFLVFSTVEFKEHIHDTNILVNVLTTENVVERFLNMDIPWLIMAPLWKRESFLNMGFWNEEIVAWQDWEFHVRALLKEYKYLYFSKVDSYVRRNNDLETIGKNSLSEKHLKSYLQIFIALKPLMIKNRRYVSKLYGLAYWVADQALAKGYHNIAKDTIYFLRENWTYKGRMIVMFKLLVFKKIYIKNLRMPDSGTMGKVYAPQ